MKNVIYLLILSFGLSSCIKDDVENNNEEIFQSIWKDMDENYGGFIPRNIDWDSMYNIYHPQAQLAQNEMELWDVCTDMLDALDDQHISMHMDTGFGFVSGKEAELASEKEFSLDNVLSEYLEEGYENILWNANYPDYQFVYGKLKGANLGYIYFPHFDSLDDNWHETIDEANTFFSDVDGLVVDVRNNGGGNPIINRYAAHRFMKDEKFIFSIQTRNGPEHDDFDEPIDYYSKSEGTTFTKPIIALTNKSTVSAGEEFMIYMQSQDHVTVLGSVTSNAFSTNGFDRFLPNGWSYQLPVQLYLYPDGTSPEGVGIIPDIEMVNFEEDVESGLDKVLERAIELLQ